MFDLKNDMGDCDEFSLEHAVTFQFYITIILACFAVMVFNILVIFEYCPPLGAHLLGADVKADIIQLFSNLFPMLKHVI